MVIKTKGDKIIYCTRNIECEKNSTYYDVDKISLAFVH